MRSWKWSLFMALVFFCFGLIQVFGQAGSIGLAFLYGFMSGFDLNEFIVSFFAPKKRKPMIACDLSTTRQGVTTCTSNQCCQRD